MHELAVNLTQESVRSAFTDMNEVSSPRTSLALKPCLLIGFHAKASE